MIEFHRRDYLTCCDTEKEREGANGLDKASPRLQKLDVLNRAMAHRPWTVTKDTIKASEYCCSSTGINVQLHFSSQALMSSADGVKVDSWSMSELMQAIIILAHFHAFSGFIQGCGKLSGISTDDDGREGVDEDAARDVGAQSPRFDIQVDDEQDVELEEGVEATESSVSSFDSRRTSRAQSSDSEVPLILKKMETLSANKTELEVAELRRRYYAKLKIVNSIMLSTFSPPRSKVRECEPRGDCRCCYWQKQFNRE